MTDETARCFGGPFNGEVVTVQGAWLCVPIAYSEFDAMYALGGKTGDWRYVYIGKR